MTVTSIICRGCRLLALAVLPMVAGISPIPAGAQAPKVAVAVYADICGSPVSGDTRGSRLILLYTLGDFDVLYQQADGWPQRPLLGRADVKDRQLQFEVTTKSGDTLLFKGTITPDEIEGRFFDAKAPTLPTPTVHWTRRPTDRFYVGDCKAPP
jgi:hypothetical protein